jgi:hypothetical protein
MRPSLLTPALLLCELLGDLALLLLDSGGCKLGDTGILTLAWRDGREKDAVSARGDHQVVDGRVRPRTLRGRDNRRALRGFCGQRHDMSFSLTRPKGDVDPLLERPMLMNGGG